MRRTFFPLSAAALPVLLVAISLVGCRKQPPPPKAPIPGPPPLRVSFRNSQIPTEGKVASITNPSETEPIKVIAVFVQGKKEKEERSYRLDREILPLDSISVGWAQLGAWKLKAGDKLRIRCEGYTGDLEREVSD
jgi:hypothetical protein